MDKELLIKAKEGDKASKEEIIKMFQPLILSCVSRIYVNGLDKSDLIQIGYVSILKAIDSFDISSDSFTAYVNNSVKNNFYYLIRGTVKLKYDTALDEEIISEDNTEDKAMVSLDTEELKNAIDKLSDYDKTLIDCLFFKGYKLKECAAMLNTSKSTICRRKERILKKLKVILKE
ncbi:MAG: sigma-70 family RNA polymerase sigma factor [Clostridiaceae bacterium]